MSYRYRLVGRLKIGDVIRLSTGETLTITKIERRPHPDLVHLYGAESENPVLMDRRRKVRILSYRSRTPEKENHHED